MLLPPVAHLPSLPQSNPSGLETPPHLPQHLAFPTVLYGARSVPTPCSAAPEEVRASEGNTWNHDDVMASESEEIDWCWWQVLRKFSFSLPISLCSQFPKVAGGSGMWLDLRARGRKREESGISGLFSKSRPCWSGCLGTEGATWIQIGRNTSYCTQRQPSSCPQTCTDSWELCISKSEWVSLQPPAATSASGLTHFLQLWCGSNNPCSALHLA